MLGERWQDAGSFEDETNIGIFAVLDPGGAFGGVADAQSGSEKLQQPRRPELFVVEKFELGCKPQPRFEHGVLAFFQFRFKPKQQQFERGVAAEQEQQFGFEFQPEQQGIYFRERQELWLRFELQR